MHGNTPYSGAPGVEGTAATDLTHDQKRSLQRGVAAIATRVREFLPEEYTVGSELSTGYNGVEAMVAVHPPIGHAVSAEFAPDPEKLTADDGPLSEDDLEEVAQGLAAGAALQVKQVMEGQVTPTAR